MSKWPAVFEARQFSPLLDREQIGDAEQDLRERERVQFFAGAWLASFLVAGWAGLAKDVDDTVLEVHDPVVLNACRGEISRSSPSINSMRRSRKA